MITTVAYVAAALSSACFGLASVLEQVGTKNIQTINSLNPMQYIRLLKQWMYMSGLALDGIGFLLFLVAVRSLPLFFVQAVGTASIAVTALAARYISRVHLGRREYTPMFILLIGLVCLAAVAAPETATQVSQTFGYTLLGLAGAAAVISAILARFGSKHPMFIAVLSGVGFSGVAISSRVAPLQGSWQHILVNPISIALAIFGTLGMLLFSMSLQKGSATVAYAVTFVTETIIPTIVGVWLLGDTPAHHLWALLVAGMGITIASTAALALSKDYTHA